MNLNRIIAALALVGILAWAVYYNARERNAPINPRRVPVSTADASQGAPFVTPPAEREVQPQSIAVTGVLRADRKAAISAKMPSRVSAILVRDGESVRAGQPLVRLDLGDTTAQADSAKAGVEAAMAQYRKALDGKRARAVEMDSQISQAEGGLRTALAKQRQAELSIRLSDSSATSDAERAQAAVRQAESGVRQAETVDKQAESTLKRMQFLYSHGGIARVDMEGAEAQAGIARAQRDSAIAALDQARAAAKPAVESAPLRRQVSEADIEAARAGVRQGQDGVKNAFRAKTETLRVTDRDIEAAKAQLDQAKAGRRQAASQIGNGTLTAPFAGIVSDVAIHAGETAQPAQPLMSVVSLDSIYLEAAVPARYAMSIRPGLAAGVRLDTALNRALHGVVSEILPVADDGRSIPLKIRLTNGGSALRPGINARADIALNQNAHNH